RPDPGSARPPRSPHSPCGETTFTVPDTTTRQTSRSPLSRAATSRAPRLSTSNPTYRHPADSGVTRRIDPSVAAPAAAETSRSLTRRLQVDPLVLARAFIRFARSAHIFLFRDLRNRNIPPALVARH